MFPDVINDVSAVSNNANEFEPCFSASNVDFETVNSFNVDEPASNSNEPQFEPEPHLQNDHIQHLASQGIEQHSQPLLAFDQPAQHVDEFIPHQQADYEISMAQPIDPELQPVIDDNSVASSNVAVAAAVAAVTGAVAAAAGATKTASPKVKPASQTEVKKLDSKVKTAPIKKATTTTTTAKAAAPRTSASKLDDKTKAAGPKIAPRTVTSKINTIADKKTTSTSSTATRKPVGSASAYFTPSKNNRIVIISHI